MQVKKVLEKRLGFTLIELVVAIGIGMLLTGGGIASYLDFNDRQELVQAGQELESVMRTAQKRSRGRVTPPGCTNLQSYQISAAQGASNYALEAVCDNTVISVNTYSTTGSVTFRDPVRTRFLSLTGGVQGSGPIVLLRAGDKAYEFSVTSGGALTTGELITRDEASQKAPELAPESGVSDLGDQEAGLGPYNQLNGVTN